MVSIFLLPLSSCGQSDTGNNNSSIGQYVGSTPCDSLIKSMMGISASVPCEFMKWKLEILENGQDSFYLRVKYGMTEPNTNGFQNGGTEKKITGKFSIEKGKASDAGSRIYYFRSPELAAPLVLVELNKGVLHFADKSNTLLIGNGGWGYVLNRQLQ